MREGLALGPGATLLGIEVVLGDHHPEMGLPTTRGRIWLEGGSGLQLFYGKNGAGKSTLLKAVADFFAGRESDDAFVRGFVRVDDPELPAWRDTGDIFVDDTWDLFGQSLFKQIRDYLLTTRARWVADEVFVAMLEAVGVERDIADAVFIQQETFAHEWFAGGSSDWFEALRYLSVLQLDADSYNGPRGFPNDYFTSLLRSVEPGPADDPVAFGWSASAQGRQSIADGSVLTGALAELRNSRIVALTSIGHDRPFWDVSLAVQLSADVPCAQQIWDESKAASEDFLRSISSEARESAEDLRRAAALQVEYFCHQGFGNLERPHMETDGLFFCWKTGLFSSVENVKMMLDLLPWPEHGLVVVGAAYQTLRFPKEIAGIGQFDYVPIPPGIPQLVDLRSANDPDGWVKDRFRRLVSSGPRRGINVRSVLDVDERRVLEGFENNGPDRIEGRYGLQDRVDELNLGPEGSMLRQFLLEELEPVDPEADQAIMWTGSDTGVLTDHGFAGEWFAGDFSEFSSLNRLNDRVSGYGEALSQLGIGLGGLRLKVEAELAAWTEGNAVSLEVFDQPSGNWVGVDQLSESQCRWVGYILEIEDEIWDDGAEVRLVVIADEVDAGVHVTASTLIFDYLSGLPGATYASSHSPTALRTPRARLRHVHRDHDGSMAVTAALPTGDAQDTAKRLGVDLLDLLATKYLAVIVEGLHDEAAIETLFSGEPILDRTLIIPGRGIKGMHAVPDATLLVDFTDLQILVIVDNARNERFQPVIETIRSLTAAGRSPDAALRESGIAGLSRTASPEERTLIEILDRATRNRSLDRLDVHGLPVSDVAMLFPPEAFGLDADWGTYERQHAEYQRQHAKIGQGRPKPFKGWLKVEHEATISKKTIETAVAGLDDYNDGLLGLMEAIRSSFTAAEISRALSRPESP